MGISITMRDIWEGLLGHPIMLLLCSVKDMFLEEREAIKTKKHGFEVGRGCAQSLSQVGVPFLASVAISFWAIV